MTELQAKYNAKQAEIADQIVRLTEKLSKNAESFAEPSNNRNWGYLWDLTRASDLLDELLEWFG